MIEAKNLTMVYGSVVALRDASFSVAKGEIVGLLGPNGAGKSTTLKILTTFLYPTSGTAQVCGKDILTEPLEVRRRVGYLPESLPLYEEMEVAEYLRFVADARGLSASQRTDRTAYVIEECGLEPVYRRPIRELSKGYRQRTALAQALIHDPEVVVLDEPTSGLDPHQILGVRRLVKSLAKNRTVIFSTHILQEVQAVAHRVVIIDRGAIVADGTIDQVARQVQEGARSEVCVRGDPGEVEAALRGLSCVRKARRLRCENGLARLEVEGAAGEPLCERISSLAAQRGWELRELKDKPFSLEETFLALTEGEEATVGKAGGA